MPDTVDTVVCAPEDGRKYHPKHVEQFPEINKLYDVASCWRYEYTRIQLGARPILHICTIRVKSYWSRHTQTVLNSTTLRPANTVFMRFVFI
jgi:hypothetical protein